MMPLLLLLFQILFLARVTSSEHQRVTLGERRGGRLIKKLGKQIDASAALLHGCCERELPLTRAFAGHLSRHFEKLQQIVDDADLKHRTDYSRARMLMKARNPGDLSMAINDYLEVYVKGLSQIQRHTIIAGCLVVGSIYPKKVKGKTRIVDRIAMQCSRSQKDLRADGRVVAPKTATLSDENKNLHFPFLSQLLLGQKS
jgi:hypothetical protein